MSSRIYRIWQPGNPKNRVFLPTFWMKLVKPKKEERLPPNFVKFEIPMEMSSHEVNEYLTKIYKLPVCEVKTEIETGKLHRNFVVETMTQIKMAGNYGKVNDKEPDKKYAYAIMKKDFQFEFPELFPKENEALSKEIKRQQKMENERNDQLEKNWQRPNETWFGL